MAIQTGEITATGQTTPITLGRKYHLSLSGFGTASITLERSFDGVTWLGIEVFTENSQKIGESVDSAQYRLNTTAYTSGTIAYRLGS